MKKEIIKITESDLHNIVNEAVNKVLNESQEGPYWYCEFVDKNGNVTGEIIWAKTTRGAFKHCFEKGMRIGAEPKYETLRGATNKEVIDFKKMIKKRAANNSIVEEIGIENSTENINSGINNEQIIDSDDEYAKNYIIGRIFDATEIMTDLVDYLENSPYALEKGGEKFKKHLSKATNIFNELEKFWDD